MSSTAVIASKRPDGERPAVTYRQAGDRYVLVEYGEHELDLRLNFVVVAVLDELTSDAPDGFVEAAPGLRSILVHFDPVRITRSALLGWLDEVHERQPDTASLVIPSRLISLPIAFDDSASAEAVERYVTTVRHDAPNTRNGTNIDYLVECNGLTGCAELYETVTGTEWWTALTGFTPGLPFLLPLDPRCRLSAPKYNPTRSWTPEGVVGMGGPCVAIYPVDSPGSYQLFGRTVPVADLLGIHDAFATDPFLIRPGDRVRFTRVSEEELNEARREVFDNRYEYSVTSSPFTVAGYLADIAGRSGDGRVSGGYPHWSELEVP